MNQRQQRRRIRSPAAQGMAYHELSAEKVSNHRCQQGRETSHFTVAANLLICVPFSNGLEDKLTERTSLSPRKKKKLSTYLL
jgi:hypothetical protein